MRHARIASLVAAGAALAAMSIGGTVAVGQGGDRAPATKRIVFYPGQPQVGPTDIDVGPAGESQGDMTVVTRPVLRRPGGAAIGRTDVSCVKTDVSIPGRPFLLCRGLFRFTDTSTITFEGGFRFPDETTSTLAVTGGTGRYFGASGTFRRVQVAAVPRYVLVLER
jgi:hypothetical protein